MEFVFGHTREVFRSVWGVLVCRKAVDIPAPLLCIEVQNPEDGMFSCSASCSCWVFVVLSRKSLSWLSEAILALTGLVAGPPLDLQYQGPHSPRVGAIRSVNADLALSLINELAGV